MKGFYQSEFSILAHKMLKPFITNIQLNVPMVRDQHLARTVHMVIYVKKLKKKSNCVIRNFITGIIC